jgi:hypothetical protein
MCLKCYSAERDGQYRNYLILHHDNVPCHTPLQCSSFWWRYKSQPSFSHYMIQIPLDVTSGSFWDSRLFSKVIVSCLYKKFNRIWEQSQSYKKRTSRGASSNGKNAGASVFVHEGSISVVTREGFIHIGFYYKLCLSSRNFVTLPHTCNISAHLLVIMMIISLMGREWYSFGKYNVIIYNKLIQSSLI